GGLALTKAGAGQLTVTGSLTANSVSVAAGTLSVAGPVGVATTFTNTGGTVTVGAAGYVYAAGDYVQAAGRTTLHGGGILAAQTYLWGGVLDGSGYVVGNVLNAARIDVGGAGVVGSLVVLGDYTQRAAGVLSVDLAGRTLLAQYDFFYVQGAVTIE